MGAHSGKYGVLNGQSTVRNWNLVDTQSPQKFVASNTAGGAGRITGVRDWTGSFAQYGHTPLVMPGEAFSFAGYTAPDNDAVGGTGTKYSGTAIVDSLVVNWNWGAGEIINVAVNFSGNGPLTVADAQAALTDATTPVVPTVIGTHIDYNLAAAGWNAWANLVSATFTLTSENQSYVNSSTAGWTERKRGPIDWVLALTEQETTRPAAKPQLGDSAQMRLYIDGSDYWALNWGHVRDYSGINVDRESGAIVQRTVNLDMNGFLSAATGIIVKPGAGANWWPIP